MVKVFSVTDQEQVDRRLDNFLLSQIKRVPKSLVYRLIRKGYIRVNGRRIKTDYHIKLGDEVKIPDVRIAPCKKSDIQKRQIASSVLDQRILFENDALLVINKPSGLPVHGGNEVSLGLIELLRSLRPAARFLELIHRLDKETSGCLLIAKKRSTLRKFHELLRNRQIKKEYIALTGQHWKDQKTLVDFSLKKNRLKSGERMVVVSEEGKKAISHFEVVKKLDNADLVHIRIITGRTHQIRVHASQMGHPIAGDQKYGDKEFNQLMKKKGLRRLFLHAVKITFPISETQFITVESPLDKILKQVLEKL